MITLRQLPDDQRLHALDTLADLVNDHLGLALATIAAAAACSGDSSRAGLSRDPQMCHRSLVTTRLRAEHGLSVTDLRPD